MTMNEVELMRKEMQSMQERIEDMHRYLRKLKKKEKLQQQEGACKHRNTKTPNEQNHSLFNSVSMHLSAQTTLNDESFDSSEFWLRVSIQSVIRRALVQQNEKRWKSAIIIQRTWKKCRKYILYPEIRLLQRKCRLHEVVLLELNRERQCDRTMIAHLLNEINELKENHRSLEHDSREHNSLGMSIQDDLHSSAIIIQKWWRGHRCRLIFNHLWLNYRLHRLRVLFSALKIEHWIRVWIDRRKIAHQDEDSVSSVSDYSLNSDISSDDLSD